VITAPATGVVWVSAGVLSTVSVGSLIAVLHPSLQGDARRPVRQAITSWWPPAVLACVTCALGPWVSYAVFAGVAAWVLLEYRRMMPIEDRPLVLLGLAAIPAVHLAFLLGHGPAAETGLLFLLFLVIPLVRGLWGRPAGMVAGAGRAGLGIALSAWSLGHLVRIYTLPVDAPAGPGGVAGVLLLGVMFSDIGQYVVGKLVGRTPLAPRVSPKKTWEGLLGGIATSASVIAAVAPVLTPWSRLEGVILGAGTAILGTLGDLLASAIKRDVGVKDSGSVLPGQGGVLDRADSFLIAAPVFYHVARWILE
jgi:phosphatidate cytidylyltransferase